MLKDRQVGYVDDFDFYKNKMINIIIPDHMQELNLDMNPAQYRHFDYEKAKKEFQEINAEYFKAIYFSLAPLLCVPMYQQIRPLEAIYGRGTLKRSSFWEDESLANFWEKIALSTQVVSLTVSSRQRNGRWGTVIRS